MTAAHEVSPRTIYRDFAAEMLEKINAGFAVESDLPLNAMVVAKRIVAELEATDPDLLAGWLKLQAEDTLRRYIGLVQASERTHNRAVSGRGAFAKAQEAHENGDSEPLRAHTTWLSTMFVVDEQYSRRALGDCTGTDLTFVSSRYEHTARTARFEATFFQTLAKKVGDKTVSEVYSEEEIVRFRDTLAQLSNG